MNDDNQVKLEFEKDLSYLAGYDFGLKTYQDQIFDKIDFSKPFIIVFPDGIKGVASSFVQGLFKEIVGQMGLIDTENNVTIKARNENVANDIRQRIE